MLDPTNHLPVVREQYEAYPYPPRAPADESRRLITTWIDDLPMINHYCFAGRQGFTNGFRVLVAGAGTGDATIFLAEQLRRTDAQIVHLDLSNASIAIAKARAQQRGLTNIEWIQGSLLGCPALQGRQFDYINCSGVLHHLADPEAGLQALLPLLHPDGALGIMVYAKLGRAGIYPLQRALALLQRDSQDAARNIAQTRELLTQLPRTNWFKRSEDLHRDHKAMGDAGLVDLLLHSTDQAYDVEELYAWFTDRNGLHLEFTDVGRGRAPYKPSWVLGPRRPTFAATIEALSAREQHTLGELLGGSIITHSFYATRRDDRMAQYGDPDMVPMFFHEPLKGPELSAMIHRATTRPIVLDHAHTGFSFELDPGQYGKFVLKHLDGQRTFGQIFELVRDEDKFRKSPPSVESLFADFRPIYQALSDIDRLLLRHVSVS